MWLMRSRYNGLLFVSEPMRQTYEIVASNQFFAPGSNFSLFDLPLNIELSESWNSGQLPPPNPPASEDYRIPPLQKAILDIRNGNSSRWSYEQNLGCMFNLSESTVSNRPNIILFIDWMDPASNNTVLLVGNLGYYGIEIFLPCPKSWYATISYGLDVWNASFTVSPYFYYWAPGYGAAVNPYLTFGDNQTCPSSYSPIPQFEPPPNQLPNVTHCLTEMV
jgi:hypothetical protein